MSVAVAKEGQLPFAPMRRLFEEAKSSARLC